MEAKSSKVFDRKRKETDSDIKTLKMVVFGISLVSTGR